MGLVILVGVATDAMGQGRGRRVRDSDRKCGKFVNCQTRVTVVGMDADLIVVQDFTNNFRRNRNRDRDFDRISRRRSSSRS